MAQKTFLIILALIASVASLKGMHTPHQAHTFFDGVRANLVELVRRLAFSHSSLVTAYDSYGNTPLHLAVTYKRTEIVKLLCLHFANAIHLRNRKTETPLHKAAQIGDREIIALLIQAGARVDAATMHGDTPLHNAACSGTIEGLDLLHAALSKINQIGYNPIHLAVQQGNQATLQKLLEYASPRDIELLTNDNETPLMMGVIYGNLPCVYLLLAHGASTETPDKNQSLLKRALTHRQHEIARFLLDHGVSIMPDTISILNKRQLSPNQSYVQFLEKVHEQRLLAINTSTELPDVLNNLIASFCLSQIVT